MIFAILLGIILGTGGASIFTAFVMIFSLIFARSMVDILIRKSVITGVDSTYVRYVRNLSETGDVPTRPWVGYLAQSCGYYIPIAIVVFFIAHYFTQK